jgi:ribosomal protein S18 acetylase RimI-like enzyme
LGVREKPLMLIRDFNIDSDKAGLRRCLVELQDFEREIDKRMPPGDEIADNYIARMLHRCRQCKGKVIIAEVDDKVAGYATVVPKVKSEDLEDGDTEFALISDLIVLQEFRRLGIGKALLRAAEAYARSCNAWSLRIGVMAANEAARELYASIGFREIYTELEKDLGETNAGQ